MGLLICGFWTDQRGGGGGLNSTVGVGSSQRDTHVIETSFLGDLLWAGGSINGERERGAIYLIRLSL